MIESVMSVICARSIATTAMPHRIEVAVIGGSRSKEVRHALRRPRAQSRFVRLDSYSTTERRGAIPYFPTEGPAPVRLSMPHLHVAAPVCHRRASVHWCQGPVSYTHLRAHETP